MNNRMKFIETREKRREWDKTMNMIDKAFPQLAGFMWLWFAPSEVIEEAFKKLREGVQKYIEANEE